MKLTTIRNNSNNGVKHVVTISLDGTVTANKYINSELVQTYDWSYMSAAEVYETAEQSGHELYEIYEEEPEVPFNQDMKAAEIRKVIKEALETLESDESYRVYFEVSVTEGYTDVSLVVTDSEGQMIADSLVASVESQNEAVEAKADKMAERLNKKYGMEV